MSDIDPLATSRYSIIGATRTIVAGAGGTDIRTTINAGVIFAALTSAQATKLAADGYKVTSVASVFPLAAPPLVTPPTPVPAANEVPHDLEEIMWGSGLEEVRKISDPLLYGEGMIMAIVDSGIRASHELMNGRVVYSKNFSSSPGTDDVFDHGTGVASVALAVAPLCSLLNMKVISDEGEATEEEVTLALDELCTMIDEQSEFAPVSVNMSLGSLDTGDPDNPMRAACRELLKRNVWVQAAAGNGGPEPGTVNCPACEKYVSAVGSVKVEPFIISEFSARGPTVEGLVKPDLVVFGDNLLVASSASDTATAAKSGTSFSTPFVSGVGLLYQEGLVVGAVPTESAMMMGMPGLAEPLPADVASDLQYLWEKMLPMVCIKPEGAPAEKDNTYGDGLFFGPLALRAFRTFKSYMALGSLMEFIPIVLVMGMMIPMVKSMVPVPSK